MYRTLYNVLVNSRSLVYIVDINADGIQENVSVAAVCPDSLLLVLFHIAKYISGYARCHIRARTCIASIRTVFLRSLQRSARDSRLCLPIRERRSA